MTLSYMRRTGPRSTFRGMVPVLTGGTWMISVLVSVFLIFSVNGVKAGGYENNSTGIRAMSLAGTYTAVSSDASAAFYNPAAILFHESNMISAGLVYQTSETSFLSRFSGNYDMKGISSIPFHLYGTYKLNERSALGLSVNTPFRFESDHEEDWPGRFISTNTLFRTTLIQPSFAFMLNEYLGVSLGVHMGFSRFEDNRRLPVEGSGGEAYSSFSGDATGFGISGSAFLKLSEETRVGLSIRSGAGYDHSDGTISYTNVPLSQEEFYPASASASSEMQTPASLNLGASHQVSRYLMVAVELQYEMWSGIDSVAVEVAENPDLSYGVGTEYKNTISLSAGGEYTVSDAIGVRAGLGYELSPVQDDRLDPRFPDADRYVFSAGGSFRTGESMVIDVVYMLENFTERESLNINYNFRATYKTFRNFIGVSLNYEF